jgi:RNA polymerase sigma factor (sigma-70 family)
MQPPLTNYPLDFYDYRRARLAEENRDRAWQEVLSASPEDHAVRRGRWQSSAMPEWPELAESTDRPRTVPTMRQLLRPLSKREQKIVRLRFVQDWSLEEIGTYLHISHQRVAQILKRAGDKIFKELSKKNK